MYTLAENLADEEHTIELFKRTQINKEYKRGYTLFYGVQLKIKDRVLSPPPPEKRKMEFDGNSITCGHAIEDITGGDSGGQYF